MRAPINRHSVDYGENINYTPPPGAASWMAWRKGAMQPALEHSVELYSELVIYGGEPPGWVEIGGYDIDGDTVIKVTDRVAESFEDVATAAGATVLWITLVGLSGGLDTDVIQFVSYDGNGKAMQIDRYVVPAANATDASTIAAQERRLLQTLLHARERAAGTGGIRKRDTDGSGEEYESLAVLDRRIAEVRARIVWFQQAAEGNALPRQEYW